MKTELITATANAYNRLRGLMTQESHYVENVGEIGVFFDWDADRGETIRMVEYAEGIAEGDEVIFRLLLVGTSPFLFVLDGSGGNGQDGWGFWYRALEWQDYSKGCILGIPDNDIDRFASTLRIDLTARWEAIKALPPAPDGGHHPDL